jgi:RNA polymerase sigma factor (sigma-70 family)
VSPKNIQRCGSIRKRTSLGSWLYAVARRIAIRAKRETALRLGRERQLDPMQLQAPLDSADWQSLRAVLDEEIGRLPEKYQAPLILCYFENKSYDRAAKELGWPKSSLTRRLTRAKELLRRRLVKRGISLTVPVLGTMLTEKATAAPVSAVLIINTVKAAGPLSLAYSPSGRVLAVAASALGKQINGKRKDTGTLHLIEMFSGQEIRQFEVPRGTGRCLAFSPDGRTVASSEGDSTIMLWDLTGRQKAPKSKLATLAAKELDGLWSDLAADAAKADAAVWRLMFAAEKSLPLFKQRLKFVAAPPDQVAKLVADLDSDQFPVRQEAIDALDEIGLAAMDAVTGILKVNLPLEQRQRLEQFLERCRKELFRQLRAIETLEQIATPAARQLLEAVAKSTANSQLRDTALAAQKRLAARP